MWQVSLGLGRGHQTHQRHADLRPREAPQRGGGSQVQVLPGEATPSGAGDDADIPAPAKLQATGPQEDAGHGGTGKTTRDKETEGLLSY